MRLIRFYNNNLSLWVILFGLVAYLYPPSFLIAGKLINWFFAAAMFGIGMVIKDEDYRSIVKDPKPVLYGNICQFTIMPLLALFVSYVFGLPKEIAVGLVLTGAAPGAMTSNVISYLSGGDVTYSVSLTALATLLSPVLTPLVTLLLIGEKVPMDFFPMFLTIITTVVLPLLAGFMVRRNLPRFVEKNAELPPAVSITAIVIITSYVIARNKGNLTMATSVVFIAVIIHNLLGMLLGFFAGAAAKFDFRRKKTLSIEIGMQNAGLGVVLALKHFSDKTAIPAAIFTIWCILSASLMVNFWKVVEKNKPNWH
ncbi:MAG: bile acid:sodium symporter family protein [Bacteroidales bacterium]|nr:bile acid:sodium symporter family protein [Bacteroidales bacterium]